MTALFSPREIIRKKRDKQVLGDQEIQFFVEGMTEGTITEAQMAALAMTIYFNGLTPEETSAMTLAMAHSGAVIDWEEFHLPGPVVDKHSSGGVGDKVSLMLAPMLAAAGAYVPMITGRGLQHTGGTTDKMNSIPGYQTYSDLELFKKTVREVGCAVIGQTPELAPADRKLYACRDNTESVSSLPLIVSSILSKKIAAGVKNLVMQVNFGSGALVPDYIESKELASALISTGKVAGLPIVGLMTDMNQVIGYSAGHALEVVEAIDFLTGRLREPRMYELTLSLGAYALALSGLYPSAVEASKRLEQDLNSGKACEYFAKMVTALGGPADLVEHPSHYFPAAPCIVPLKAVHAGYVASMNTREVGMSVIGLGGGRIFADDKIDYRVGLSDVCHAGTYVEAGQPLMMIHARTLPEAERASHALARAILISPDAPETLPVIREIMQ